MGYIHAYMTASTVEDVDGELVEDHGWVDPSWSLTVLHGARNDAGTVLSMDIEDEDLEESLNDLLVGYEDSGYGSWYAQDTYQDPATGIYWSYALHLKHKYFSAAGWIEVPYIRESK